MGSDRFSVVSFQLSVFSKSRIKKAFDAKVLPSKGAAVLRPYK